jgi:hypothetical protein
MSDKTIGDVMICPTCGSEDCYMYNTDECYFEEDNTGVYIIDCSCKSCKAHFRLYTKFAYSLTSASVSTGSGKDKIYKEYLKKDD